MNIIKIYLVLLILPVYISFVLSEKILFVACTPAPSHQKPFQVIWKALSQRGHDVYVLTPNPLKNPKLRNLTEYDLSDLYLGPQEIARNNKELYTFLTRKPDFLTAFKKDLIVTKLLSKFYVKCLNHNETKRLLKENKYFDVAIIEWLFPTMAALGAYYQIPVVGISSLGAPVVALDTLGNPTHPIIAPDINLPLTRDMSLKERFLAVLYSIYVRIYYHWIVLPQEDDQIKNYLSPNLPSLGIIEKNISVLLMNRNPIFHRTMPLTPATVELGVLKYPKVEQVIEPKLKKFMDNSKNGIIYISLGTSIRGHLLPNEKLNIFKQVFKSLPYNVVWKWDEEEMKEKPDNVFISKWIPQVSILEHPKVKLFITQGGLQSMEETIAAHKPIIGIPFHSDQTSNVDTCVKYGMGTLLDLENLTEETLRTYIKKIVNDSRYTENAKKLDILMKDQPQDGLEKAIWWIEYVIRHNGAKHLRSPAVELPWWQYLMLDLIAFILFLTMTIVFVIYFIANISFKIFCIVFLKLRRYVKCSRKYQYTI